MPTFEVEHNADRRQIERLCQELRRRAEAARAECDALEARIHRAGPRSRVEQAPIAARLAEVRRRYSRFRALLRWHCRTSVDA